MERGEHVTNPHEHVANPHEHVANLHEYVTNLHEYVTNLSECVANMSRAPTIMSGLRLKRYNGSDNRCAVIKLTILITPKYGMSVHRIVILRRELNSEAQRFVKNPMQATLLGAFDSSIVCEVDY